jgi:leucine dehydrogenase
MYRSSAFLPRLPAEDFGSHAAPKASDIRSSPSERSLTISLAKPERFPNHEQVLFICNRAAGLRAIIAIHNTARGPAFGGCRMRPYSSPQDALRDALRLSCAMSYKAALAGIAFGGGKCVVLGDPATAKTERLLLALGRAIQHLGGRYLTADDVGTSVLDMEVLRRVTPHARGLPDKNGEPCPATAYGTFMAIKAAVRHRLGRTDLTGVSIAVQGLGSVGFKLCDFLSADGAALRVSDLHPELVARAQQSFGATPIPVDRILAEKVDVLSPNALGDVFDNRTVPLVRAAIVAGAANNQLKAAHHGIALHRQGVLYVPDYVVNAGGLIDVAHEGPGYDTKSVLQDCGRIYDRTLGLIREAERHQLAISALADRKAEALLNSSLAQGQGYGRTFGREASLA